MSGPWSWPMAALLTALLLPLIGGLLALAGSSSRRWAHGAGVTGAVAGSLAGLATCGLTLAGNALSELRLPWTIPYGSFHLELDSLGAFFLIPLFLLTGLAAIYGAGYWRNEAPRRAAWGWFCFNLLTASMALVLTARNAVLFLSAWEIMTFASYFLVAFEHARPDARRAGWIYLVASHIGAAFLLLMFMRLGGEAGSFEFESFTGFAGRQADAGAGILLLATVGFGLKAGFVPLHGWLPIAHPAAPSHVSAVMSGVMIKTGIYGLARLFALAGGAPVWFPWVLIAIGAASGVLGVLWALGQHDLKRLLAYSSVENIGIIALGMGVGLAGETYGLPLVAFLGWAGALFHVLNHALFKGLLFLGAGAVGHGAGGLRLDRLGGLLRRMPGTGLAFLVGSVAIAGLPPFNGFAGEFLIYYGACAAAGGPSSPAGLGGALALTALALIGGLAAACFVRAFGIVFLGEPRGPEAAGAREAGPSLRGPMLALAALCLTVGLASPLVLRTLQPAVAAVLTADAADGLPAGPPPGTQMLTSVAGAGLGLLLAIGALAALRRRLLAGRAVETAVTWDCGYAQPTARMQYTASSFAAPLLESFQPRRRRGGAPVPRVLFPPTARFDPRAPEGAPPAAGLASAALSLVRRLDFLRWMQHGRLHLYVLYILITLILLLAVGL